PVGGDFARGQSAAPLRVTAGGGELALGALICYEDVFAAPARASVLAGADVLTVHTNNGWFGRGGASAQHAAHSVLRAVELRRPVLRAGDAGWSGGIDVLRGIRPAMTSGADGVVTKDPPEDRSGYVCCC